MKYAVVEHAGKQFVAAEGQLVEVDRLALQAGSAVEFGEVLLLRDTDRVEVGAPYIQGARVTGKIQAHLRGPKILVFKYRAKQRYRVRQGHRQALTRVTIESIGLPGTSAQAATTAEPKPQPAEPRRTARKPASSAARRPASPPKAKATAQPAAARPKSGARKADKGKQPKAGQAAKKPAAQKKSAGSKKK